MAADAGFLRRLYAESARLLQQDPGIQHWRVLVICPHRALGFGDPTAVAEFVQERVHWLELEPALQDPAAPPLLRTLALLVQSEALVAETVAGIREAVAGSADAAATLDVMAAIVISRFSGRPLQEICAMGGITLEDLRNSVAYREIYGEGREEGRQEGEFELIQRLLRRRCGSLSPEQNQQLRTLTIEQREALSEALLDFQGAADLDRWFATRGQPPAR